MAGRLRALFGSPVRPARVVPLMTVTPVGAMGYVSRPMSPQAGVSGFPESGKLGRSGNRSIVMDKIGR